MTTTAIQAETTARPEVLRSLDSIADEIRAAWDTTRSAQVNAWAGYFRTGHLLIESRDRFEEDDTAYGEWFTEQDFGFTTDWGRKLRVLAAHEDEAQAYLDTAVSRGDPQPGVNIVLREVVPSRKQQLLAKLREGPACLDDLSPELGHTARNRVGELTRDGWSISSRRCRRHAHDGQVAEYRLDSPVQGAPQSPGKPAPLPPSEAQRRRTQAAISKSDHRVVEFVRLLDATILIVQEDGGLALFSPEARRFIVPKLQTLIGLFTQEEGTS